MLKTITLFYGIFLALTHIILGAGFLIEQFSSSPVVILILNTSISVVSSLTGLCELIAAIGLILIGKRLQSA